MDVAVETKYDYVYAWCPPGTAKDNKDDKINVTEAVSSNVDVTIDRELSTLERHPGDDEVAAKFQLMLAAHCNESDDVL